MLSRTMFNTAVTISLPPVTVAGGKGKPEGDLVRRLNFIKVTFMSVNILPGFHRDFCVCYHVDYIIAKQLVFLTAE